MSAGSLYIAYDPVYVQPLPPGHRFPMAKYELIAAQLLYEGLVQPQQLHAPAPATAATICLAHEPAYFEALTQLRIPDKAQRQTGFPQSASLVHRERVITQGSLNCALHALQHGVALNIAGGTHHAFADHGEGFCLLNDFAVAANYLLHQRLCQRILIIDLDVHQGNGTAKIFEAEPAVFTFSMHGRHNYPFRKEHSDLDVPLEDGLRDRDYLALLHTHLPALLTGFRPDLAFYLSGVDILETDRFGKLKVSMQGCRERDRFVFEQLHQRRIPVAVAMGGGYSPQVRDIVQAHCQTFREAAAVYGQ